MGHRHFNGLKTAAAAGRPVRFPAARGWSDRGGRAGGCSSAACSASASTPRYCNSDKLALRSMRARPVSEAEQPAMYRIVRELATSARQPMPRLYISPTARRTPSPPGATRGNAAVCSTEGILQLLDERELRGVLGHELSHVYNRDILISSVAGGGRRRITMLGQVRDLLRRRRRRATGNPFAAMLMLLLGPLAATSSRWPSAARGSTRPTRPAPQLTGDPLALASALRKLEAGSQPRRCRKTPAGQHQPPDDRQPVPRRRRSQPVLHPPADGRAHRPPRAMAGYRR